MENRQATLFSLQEIAKRDLSTLQADILRVLSLGNADEAALQLDFFCPPLAQGGEVTAYLWAIWDVVIDVVRSPDTTSEIHEHIVSILQSLIPIRKGEILAWNATRDLWEDLPLFPQCMESWLDNPFDYPEDLTPEAIQMWRNLSSFAARCTGVDVLSPSTQVIRALQEALEGELEIDRHLARVECNIQVASEWIAHSAKPLLCWALENVGLSDIETNGQHFAGGSLYRGPPMVCLQRWDYWQNRFEELGKATSLRDELRKAALEAAETMDVVKRQVSNTP